MGPDSSGEHRPHQLREKLGQLDVGVAGAGFTRQFMDAALGRRQQQHQSLDFQESRTRSGRRIFEAGVASPTYTDATLTVGATVIKANHLKEDLHPEATASNPGCSRALLLALITEVPYTSSRPLARAEPVNKNETAGS